jgi:hypothetical protein
MTDPDRILAAHHLQGDRLAVAAAPEAQLRLALRKAAN